MPIYQLPRTSGATVAYVDAVTYSALQAGGAGPPGVNDDEANTSGNGYEGVGWYEGSLWTDSLTGNVYVCLDSTEGAAVWKKIAGPTVSLGGQYWQPADLGFKAWTFDPMHVESTSILTSGRIEFQRIRLHQPETITGANIQITTIGATLTSGQNLIGLYTTAGVRVATSATQHLDWVNLGLRSAPFTAPYAAAAGDYFVGFISVGTTPPTLARAQNTNAAPNGLLTTPLSGNRHLRSISTAQSTLPTPYDFATLAQATGTPFWVALY